MPGTGCAPVRRTSARHRRGREDRAPWRHLRWPARFSGWGSPSGR